MSNRTYACTKGDIVKNFTIISDEFVEYAKSKGRTIPVRKVKVKCSCGTEYIKRVDDILGRIAKSKFSWCIKCRDYPRGKTHPDWEGEGELPKRLYNRFKKNAEIRGLDWNVDMKYLWELFLQQNRKCAISNIPLHFDTDRVNTGWISSLDRIDSSKGYTKDNVRWIYTPLNIMKTNFSDEMFFELCSVVSHHNKVEWSYDKFLSEHGGRFLYGKRIR